jgi:hypothetical protein
MNLEKLFDYGLWVISAGGVLFAAITLINLPARRRPRFVLEMGFGILGIVLLVVLVQLARAVVT